MHPGRSVSRVFGALSFSVPLVASLAWIALAGPAAPAQPRGAAPARTHQVTVNADGSFSPPFLYVAEGDTVEWLLGAPTDSVVPVDPSAPDLCDGHKPYDPADPNEFPGPMPQWPSGIFTLGPDDRGNTIVSSPSQCPTRLVAAAGGQYLCRNGAEGATMPWTWQNPNLTGVFIRIQWKDVHLGPDNFDWTILDREVDRAVLNGKLYNLAFKAGSNGTPDWIFTDPGHPVTRLTFQDTGDDLACETPPCCGVVMDLGSPADPNFRHHYFALLRAAALHLRARNDRYRALAYIKPSGMNLLTHENRLPKRCECDCPVCNSEVWATQGNYTPAALYEFYQLQSELLSAEFPGKSMSYALIQDGFPRVNSATEYETCENGPPASPSGVEQTETILQGGRIFFGLDFVVQHNGLQTRPQDRDPPFAPCPDEGVHPHLGPYGNGPGCPNRWVLREGARGQVTGFQTTNAEKVGNPLELESSLRNARGNTDAIFLEIYEERFWEAEVGGPVLDPNGTGRTIAGWADDFHAFRRSFFPALPDPFPPVHRHVFTRTVPPSGDAQLFHYVHGSKCGQAGAAGAGVIAVLPQGVATPTITATPAGSATATATLTASATATRTATAPASASATSTTSPTQSATAAATVTRTPSATAAATVTRSITLTVTATRPAATATRTATAVHTVTATRTTRPCAGDCNGDGEVSVDELVRGVNIALGSAPARTCAGVDTNGDREVTVDELVAAVNAALRGC